MKKKTSPNQTVTVSILNDVLTQALDKQDKKLELTLNKRDDNFFAFMRAEIKGTIYESEVRLKDEFVSFADKLFTKIDTLLKEVVDSREHMALSTQDDEDFKKTLQIHEKRIVKLEGN